MVGYIFNRNTDAPEPFLQFFDEQRRGALHLPYSEIANIKFTGKDTAAGNSWKAWVERKEQEKAQRATASGADGLVAILILTAVELEARALARAARAAAAHRPCRSPPSVAARSGSLRSACGPASSSPAGRALLAGFDCPLVVSAGVCGGLDPDSERGRPRPARERARAQRASGSPSRPTRAPAGDRSWPAPRAAARS